MAFIVVLFGENVPVPELDHIAPLAMVNEPFSVTVALFPCVCTTLVDKRDSGAHSD